MKEFVSQVTSDEGNTYYAFWEICEGGGGRWGNEYVPGLGRLFYSTQNDPATAVQQIQWAKRKDAEMMAFSTLFSETVLRSVLAAIRG